MQVLYVVSFLALIMTMIVSIGRPYTEPKDLAATMTAMHMTAWHRAASDKCVKSVCLGGSVDPRGYFPKPLSDGSAFNRENFMANYDVASGYLVTFMDPSVKRKTDITYGLVSGSLSNLLGSNTSTHIGVWDGVNNRVNFPRGMGTRTFMSVPELPASLVFNIPNGSPVIITNLL